MGSYILFCPCFSSRPTAVNLSDAATKLKEVIAKAAASASDAHTVFQVVTIFCVLIFESVALLNFV